MKEYKVYAAPDGSHEAVKQGWSWPACFFTSVWALVKRMWALGLAVLAGFILLGVIEANAPETTALALGLLSNILSLAASIVFGRYGNAWREKNLLGRGYRHVDTVSAASPAGAVALYMKGRGEG